MKNLYRANDLINRSKQTITPHPVAPNYNKGAVPKRAIKNTPYKPSCKEDNK